MKYLLLVMTSWCTIGALIALSTSPDNWCIQFVWHWWYFLLGFTKFDTPLSSRIFWYTFDALQVSLVLGLILKDKIVKSV